MSRRGYDLAPGSEGPAPGDLWFAVDECGEPTGRWFLITAARPVSARRPRPFDRWLLEVVRQEGPMPDGPRAWPHSSYPRGIAPEEWWAGRS